MDKKKYVDLNLSHREDWFLEEPVVSLLNEYFFNPTISQASDQNKWLEERKKVLYSMARAIRNGSVPLAKNGPCRIRNVEEIDKVVIHHTGRTILPTDHVLCLLHAMHMINIYIKPRSDKDNPCYGEPLWSGNFKSGRQIFFAYHYLVYPDGTVVNLLNDRLIGGHSGLAEINGTSIAIAFLGNFMEDTPTKEQIYSVEKLLAKYPNCEILGHREVKGSTTCPGNTFLGKDGWKEQLT